MRAAFEVLAPGRLQDFVVLRCQELLAGAVPVLQVRAHPLTVTKTCVRVQFVVSFCQEYWAFDCACVRWWCRISEPWHTTAATATSRAIRSCCRATLRSAFHADMFDVVVHGPVRRQQTHVAIN